MDTAVPGRAVRPSGDVASGTPTVWPPGLVGNDGEPATARYRKAGPRKLGMVREEGPLDPAQAAGEHPRALIRVSLCLAQQLPAGGCVGKLRHGHGRDRRDGSRWRVLALGREPRHGVG